MDNSAAVKRVQNTFLFPFNEDKFKTFTRDMFKGLNEAKSFSVGRAQVKEAFRSYIKSYKRIGQYIDGNGEVLDVLMVKLDKASSLDRARTLQRNFVADYLKERDGHDAAIVAFYHEDLMDWRFSFIKMEYRTDLLEGRIKIKTELTPARRYSFLVGENEPNHTAQTQITPLLEREDKYSLGDLENSFNIESITKEFFNEYKKLYIKLKEELDSILEKDFKIKIDFEKNNIKTEHFTKKLLGQIVFLYFLQKKGWLGVEKDIEGSLKPWGTGPKNFMRKLFEKEIVSYKNFFNDVLEPLFYEALATEHENGYYSRLKCRIPFLNGGLFEPINGYNWQETEIRIDNDIIKTILDIFDLYNFTVKEDEPLEKEVAIDPEMLGKVFENLLEVKDRKSKGTFYTPREIVHYMCQESLINYLDVKLNTEKRPIAEVSTVQGTFFDDDTDEALTEDVYIEKVPKKDIEEFIRHGDFYIDYALRNEAKRKDNKSITGIYKERELPSSIINKADIVDSLLHEVKICDPAIGSGAFPVGLMNEIVRARYALSAYGETDPNRTIYNFKRQCIKDCIYGVDIDSAAIDIAKLRLWLSLIVDEDDFKNIQPLPNLDYKIVCGNSLLGVDLDNLFVDEALNRIEKLKKQYFGETSSKKKKELHKQIDDILFGVTGQKNSFDYKIHFSEIFHQNKGFDIVVANPPYVSNRNMHKLKMSAFIKICNKLYYSAKSGNYDLYILFVEKGLKLLGTNSHLMFIIPNKFLIAKYSHSILNFIHKHFSFLKVYDFSTANIFKEASVYPIVILLRNTINNSDLTEKNIMTYSNNLNIKSITEWNYIIQKPLCEDKKYSQVIYKIDNMNTINSEIKYSPGINGFQFSNYSKCVTEGYQIKDSKRLITTGAIDRYKILGKPIKYKGNTYVKPYIYFDSDIISPGKWELFSTSKIIVAGMTKVLEATLDYYGNMAPAVSVYSIIPNDINKIRYITAIINSKLINWYFLKRFEDKHLAGGYISINTNLLKQVPIPQIQDYSIFDKLVNDIYSITEANDFSTDLLKQGKLAELETTIDQMVYELYDLTPEEINIVEEYVK